MKPEFLTPSTANRNFAGTTPSTLQVCSFCPLSPSTFVYQAMITPDKILLMLAMFACSLGPVKQQNRYFEVLEATSQEWISGVPGGGRGITYRLRIKINTDKPIAFDSLWVAGKKLNTRLVKGGQDAPSKPAKNEVVTLLASGYRGSYGKSGRRPDERVYEAPMDSVKAPVAYQGAALLKYVVDGTARYVAVPSITVLPTIYGQ
jgi:hypothetical protein